MIADLGPYAEYKDSGVPWAAHVPRHWQVLRLRHVCALSVSSVDKHVMRDEIPVRVCNYVHAYKNERITPRVTLSAGSVKPAELERFRLFPGDVLITKDSESWTDIGVPSLVALDDPGVVCGYHLAILRPRQGTIGGYVLRALQAPGIAHQLHAKASGVTRFGLSLGAINGVWLPVPPASEQAAIVRFLDWATRRVDRAIRAKRRLVALLTEQKQAIIHRAVTQGLDPSVPMKESGIPWLGEIPAHWEVRRLRASVVGCFNGVWGEVPSGASDMWCVRVADFERQRLRVSDRKLTMRGIPVSARNRRILVSGDLLIEKSGGGDRQPVGTVVLYDHDRPAVCSNFVARMPVAKGYVPSFLVYLHATIYGKRITLLSTKQTTGIQNLDSSQYLSEPAAFPPLPEQAAIVAHLDDATADINSIIERTQRQIGLLREYRARLVADVVTGKLDVRAFAETLPDEAPDDIEAIEADVDEDADDDETGDGADEG